MTLITTNIYKTNILHDLQMSPWVLEVFNKRCLFSYWCTPDPSQRCGRDKLLSPLTFCWKVIFKGDASNSEGLELTPSISGKYSII